MDEKSLVLAAWAFNRTLRTNASPADNPAIKNRSLPKERRDCDFAIV